MGFLLDLLFGKTKEKQGPDWLDEMIMMDEIFDDEEDCR